MYVAATGTTPPMPSPWTNRKAVNRAKPGETATARLASAVTATPSATVRTRPMRSPSQPATSAPSSMPTEPLVTISVPWPVLSFHCSVRTGSAEAVSNWSNASKNVTAPMSVRTLMCQRELGRRSSLAEMELTVGPVATIDMGILPRTEELR